MEFNNTIVLRSVFLADDDADDISMFSETLTDIDNAIHFAFATDGVDTLRQLGENSGSYPDIIFLDLNMPKMDGIQCLAVLKSDHLLKKIPVIMLSTSSRSHDVNQTLSLGAAGFITKPTNLRELKNILFSIITSHPTQLLDTFQRLRRETETSIFC